MKTYLKLDHIVHFYLVKRKVRFSSFFLIIKRRLCKNIGNKPYPIKCLKEKMQHSKDIVSKFKEVISLISGQIQLSTIEFELQDHFGVTDLETIFTNFNKFFDFHLKDYSKNKRYSPIYWPLSTASGSYTVWLYYPKLT